MTDTARILDRGYRRYDGRRRGLPGAMRTVIAHSMRHALGIKRKNTAKIAPLLTIGLAFIPAIVFVGIVALIKNESVKNDVLPSYAGYYGYIAAAIFIFSAFVTPELLCPDRRTGLLGMYLASPLDRNTYLVSKAVAVLSIISIITIGPQLLMLVAYTILGQGPGGPLGWGKTILRILAGGLCVSMLHTSLSLAVASTTTRKAAASATTILIIVGSGAVTGALVFRAGASVYLQLCNFLRLPFESVLRIFGERTPLDNGRRTVDLNHIHAAATIGANIGWTLVFGAFVWWRYRRLVVTR